MANEHGASMDKIVSLCKRRGFVYPSSEIYGGLSATWDYGPLGSELKNNIQQAWWKEMVRRHENIVGLDAAIMMHPRTWEASGHVENFSDPLVDCKKCKTRFRADHLEGIWAEKGITDGTCPEMRRGTHRGPSVQPDVHHPHGPRGRRGQPDLSGAPKPPRASS